MQRTSAGRQHTPRTTHALNSTPLATSVTTKTVRRVPFAVQNVHAAGTSATTGTTHTIHSSATELKNAAAAKAIHTARGSGSPRARHLTIPAPKTSSHAQTSMKRPHQPHSTSQVKWLLTSVR